MRENWHNSCTYQLFFVPLQRENENATKSITELNENRAIADVTSRQESTECNTGR